MWFVVHAFSTNVGGAINDDRPADFLSKQPVYRFLLDNTSLVLNKSQTSVYTTGSEGDRSTCLYHAVRG